jgi:hypothetical protein
VFSSNQMPAKIEQIGNRSMCTQESLGLLHGFELPHPSLPNPDRLVRLLGPSQTLQKLYVMSRVPLTRTHKSSMDMARLARLTHNSLRAVMAPSGLRRFDPWAGRPHPNAGAFVERTRSLDQTHRLNKKGHPRWVALFV